MPYYKWQGVDFSASYRRGRLFACTIDELERVLLHHGIALTRAKVQKHILITPISQSQLVDFFKHISVLLQSGILLPQALAIVSEQTAHGRLQKMVLDVGQAVSKGVAFSAALNSHGAIFSSVIVHMVRVGEESGCIAGSIDALVVYLEMAKKFKKKIKAAAVMPCFTLIAFFVITSGVIIGIVPRFAQLFSSMGKELPEITQHLIYVSDALQSSFLWAVLVGVVGFIFLIYRLFRWRLKPYIDALFLRLPIVNTLIVNSAMLYWLHALSMLLKNKVSLVPALRIVHPLVQNHYLKKSLATIANDVFAGKTLRFAMVNAKMQPFTPDVLALIQVGQESGELAHMVEKAGAVYHSKVERMLRFCTLVVQPLLLLVMGLLVAFLVFALYMPIFNLAQIG